MRIHNLSPKKGVATVIPEIMEDLWRLRRIIAPNDLIVGETSRVLKQTGDHIRPDKGERIRVNITLMVVKASLDSTLDRLRISGKIVDVSEESLSKGSFHSMSITLDKKISIRKDKWSDLETRILREAESDTEGFVIVAIDRREAGLGIVKGTHLQTYPVIYSGESGKLYVESKGKEEPYFDRILKLLRTTVKRGWKLFISGPGSTKNIFHNFISAKGKNLGMSAEVVTGLDLSGQDGVYMTLRSPDLRNSIKGMKIVQASNILEETMKRISMGDKRVALAFRNSNEASIMNAIGEILVSDKIFDLGVSENDLVALLNRVELSRGKIFLVDSSTDVGSQVSALGGLVSLLRFSI